MKLSDHDSLEVDTPKSIRIFISSPGDVADERQKAMQVVASLQVRYGGEVALVPLLWEQLPIPATASFQEGIDTILSTTHHVDIAVFILWTRLGTPLSDAIKKPDGTPYRSGTEREFDLFLTAFEKSGRKRPLILAYTRKDNDGFNARLDARTRKTEELQDMLRQRDLADAFILERFSDKKGRNIAAHHSYLEPVTFAQRLDSHLRDKIDALLGLEASATLWQESPYRSLEVFDIQHSPIFCGRDEETCDILLRLREQEKFGCGFVCIVGASGSGKSSLARAGVAATLVQRSYDEGVKEWRTLVFVPSLTTGDLFTALVQALAENLPELTAGVGSLDRFARRLEDGNLEAASDLLESAFKAANEKAKGTVRLLMVLDQMEELWTDRRISSELRESFLTGIESLARGRSLSVLATLRSDFYPQAQLSETFIRLKGVHGHVDLRPPGPAALQKLILQPARRSGLTFEKEPRTGCTLDQKILEDATRDPSALPLLQYALSELFERRDEANRRLTFEAYSKIGGVEGALGQRASQVFERLPTEAKSALDEILPLIVSVDAAGEQNAVRRRALLEELTATPARRLLVESLTAARFITTDLQNGVAIASFAHEALLRCWDRITEWIASNRNLLRMRAQLEQSHQRWVASSSARSLLLPDGLPLEEGRRLLIEARHLLSLPLIDYVRQSIADYLRNAIESGRKLETISQEVETHHPEVWHDVITQAFRSDLPVARRHAALLQARRASREFSDELIRLALEDPDDLVRQGAAESLVIRGDRTTYERIRHTKSGRSDSALASETRSALARMLAVADMQPRRPEFADWFAAQEARLTRSVRNLSRWLRLKAALPTLLLILVLSAAFAVVGAASVKWLPSAFNYSAVQATGSAMMGLFHSAPSGSILGGGIALGLTLYRLVFGREYDSVSILKPMPAIAFGACSGLIAGILCVAMIAYVYHPDALYEMGWTSKASRPPAAELFGDLFFRNHCGLAFPLTSIGLGIALALMTNSLRASKEWPKFVEQQKPLSSFAQLVGIIGKLMRLTLPYAVFIPLLVPLFACIALIAMNLGGGSSLPKGTSTREILLGGMTQRMPTAFIGNREAEKSFLKDQAETRRIWKTTSQGRALGLLGDCLAKMTGGYLAIVGMGLGIVLLRNGVKIEPKRV